MKACTVYKIAESGPDMDRNVNDSGLRHGENVDLTVVNDIILLPRNL